MRPTVAAAGRGLAVVAHALMALGYLGCAVVALWPGVLNFNAAIRGGVAAFFLGRAGLSAISVFRGTRGGAIRPEQVVRGYLLLSYGYVASSVLVGIGALWYGGVLGFLVAYAALSLAWIWYWVRKTLVSEPVGAQGRVEGP